MNIQQLHYFLNICETKSLTKSAGLLFLTQPALSKSIASLEKELGASLFKALLAHCIDFKNRHKNIICMHK